MIYELTDEEKAELARVELIRRDENYEAAVAAQAAQAEDRAAAIAEYQADLARKNDSEVQAEYDSCTAAVAADPE